MQFGPHIQIISPMRKNGPARGARRKLRGSRHMRHALCSLVPCRLHELVFSFRSMSPNHVNLYRFWAMDATKPYKIIAWFGAVFLFCMLEELILLILGRGLLRSARFPCTCERLPRFHSSEEWSCQVEDDVSANLHLYGQHGH